jgi:uncharacterized protein YciI
VKYVVFYHAAPDVHLKAGPHAAAHEAHLRALLERGDLLMVGTFADPQTNGAMAVLRSRESAEEFATEDPFVLHGVVSRFDIKEWNEILSG